MCPTTLGSMIEAERYIIYPLHFFLCFFVSFHYSVANLLLGGGTVGRVIKAVAYLQKHDPCRAKKPDRRCGKTGFGRDGGEMGTGTVIGFFCGSNERSSSSFPFPSFFFFIPPFYITRQLYENPFFSETQDTQSPIE